MNLNISYQQKEAAKSAFRAAGIPLTWNSSAKRWETSATVLPAILAQYAPTAAAAATSAEFFYIAQQTGNAGFNFVVEACFDTKQELVSNILSGRWLSGWAEGEASIFASAAYVVVASKKISVGKSIPNSFVTGNNKLCESKNDAVRAAVLAAMQE